MSKNILFALFTIIVASSVKAQTVDSLKGIGPDDNKIFVSVEHLPEFRGGLSELAKYLKNNMHYPDSARTNHVQGRVLVQFIVERDGSLARVRVVRGISANLDAEALRLVKTMPKWRPGLQGGRPVRTEYMVPVYFTL